MKLSWHCPKKAHSGPASANEPLVILYHVEKLQGNTENWDSVTSFSTNDTDISYQVTGLDPGTSYKFRVIAEGPKGKSRPLTTQQTHRTECLSGKLNILFIIRSSQNILFGVCLYELRYEYK